GNTFAGKAPGPAQCPLFAAAGEERRRVIPLPKEYHAEGLLQVLQAICNNSKSCAFPVAMSQELR
ncbi:MAG: hypothetical protein AAFY05_03725, partial [Pseudomonadota bacterium]